MKRIFIIITLLCVCLLSSCVTDTKPASSIPVKEDASPLSTDEQIGDNSYDSSDDTQTISTDSGADVSDESEENDAADSSITEHSGSDETKAFGDFFIESNGAKYEFFADSATGSYTIEFNSASANEQKITITLSDGRAMELNYSKIVFDEENNIHRTEINGLDFMVSEYHDSLNNLCQVFDCIEPMENLGDFNGRVISTIIVKYYPELEKGDINMTFLYEIVGDEVTIRYPDGKELTKTIKYDNSAKQYYFGD